MKLFTNGTDSIIAESAEEARYISATKNMDNIDGIDEFHEETRWPYTVRWEDAPEGQEITVYESVEDMLNDFPAKEIIFSME